jgi:hypothetical protein
MGLVFIAIGAAALALFGVNIVLDRSARLERARPALAGEPASDGRPRDQPWSA